MNQIESVIKQRLNLQSTKLILEQQFRIVPSFEFLKQAQFKTIFNSWDQMKQNKFIVALGGRVNFKQTQKYLSNLS